MERAGYRGGGRGGHSGRYGGGGGRGGHGGGRDGGRSGGFDGGGRGGYGGGRDGGRSGGFDGGGGGGYGGGRDGGRSGGYDGGGRGGYGRERDGGRAGGYAGGGSGGGYGGDGRGGGYDGTGRGGYPRQHWRPGNQVSGGGPPPGQSVCEPGGTRVGGSQSEQFGGAPPSQSGEMRPRRGWEVGGGSEEGRRDQVSETGGGKGPARPVNVSPSSNRASGSSSSGDLEPSKYPFCLSSILLSVYSVPLLMICKQCESSWLSFCVV